MATRPCSFMRQQPLFLWYRHRQREREHEIRTAFNLKFNEDNYAIPTPEFWDAWRADKNSTIRRQYAPAKYPADQLGLSGEKPVWVVFVSRSAKKAFEAKRASSESADTTGSSEASHADGEIKGLGWHARTAHTGMFFDERSLQERGTLVAWLNYRDDVYSVNVVSDAFQLTHSIPPTITDLGDAVDWVYKNSVWTPKCDQQKGKTSRKYISR